MVTHHYNFVLTTQIYQTASCINTAIWMPLSVVLGQNIMSRASKFFIIHHPMYLTYYITMHMARSPWPSPSVTSDQKLDSGEDLGMRLIKCSRLRLILKVGRESGNVSSYVQNAHLAHDFSGFWNVSFDIIYIYTRWFIPEEGTLYLL